MHKIIYNTIYNKTTDYNMQNDHKITGVCSLILKSCSEKCNQMGETNYEHTCAREQKAKSFCSLARN